MGPNVETEFLNAIFADPANPEPRLVYADWLEEHGDDADRAKAEYLRLSHAFDSLPADDPGRPELGIRLADVREKLPIDWWIRFDRAVVDNCDSMRIEFEFQCPKTWNSLEVTDVESVRDCSECRRHVYYCHSTEEARQKANLGQCIAIDSRLCRPPLDPRRQIQPRRITMGVPAYRHITGIELDE